MRKLRLFVLSGLLFLFGTGFAAEHTVASGDSIQPVINAAAPGDVIILENGGHYSENLLITKSITIKAVDGYTVRPVITQSGTNGLVFGETPTGAEVILNGIEFASTGARYLARIETGDSLVYLEMTDVVAHGYDRSIIRASNPGIHVDSILIDNSYFYDCLGSDYRLFYLNDTPVSYFKAVNSTFVDFSRTFLQLVSANTKTVIVENCNIHGRSDSREDDLFDITGDVGTSFTLSNSIISFIKLGRIWDLRDNVVDSIMNCYYFKVDSIEHVADNSWSYETAFTETDPMFSNGPAGALYLTSGSPALTASTTGGVIGDPRWSTPPNPASLFRLTLDAGMLSPSFETGTLDYTADLPYGTDTVVVEAVANYAGAAITGTGEIIITAGSGVATVVVTAEDGVTTQTYTVTITVPTDASTDASLSALTINPGTLTPAFDSATYAYTAEVPPGTTSVTVNATANDSGASVDGDGDTDVSSGSATVTIIVTAEDGTTTQTYTIEITRDNTGLEMDVLNLVNMHYNSISDQLRIFNSAGVEMVQIYSLTGALVSSGRFYNRESLDISTSMLSNGLYVVRMKLSSSEIRTGKFVK